MYRRILGILVVLLALGGRAAASHIVGGEVTYKYIGDSLGGTTVYQQYLVSLTIYEDCLNGDPEAIAQDNPAFMGLFDATTQAQLGMDTNVYYTSSISVPANFSNSCISNIPPICLLKKTFVKQYDLAPSAHGYIIAYQRCCRNAAIENVLQPDQHGATYYCVIPPTTVVNNNNSAIFKNYPPQIICMNNPLYYDNSATDADGDSLSYGFATAVVGANDPGNAKPDPTPPFNAPVYYISPYSSGYPVASAPALTINPVTGIITGTPNAVGRYLVNVYCNEYRHGIRINTVYREFQFVVTPCTKVVVADIPEYSSDPNTYIVECNGYTVNFINTSKGGYSYHWDFGVPGTASDTSDDFEPTFTYPDTGTYTVKLVVNPHSTCSDSITRLVKVYPFFRAAFTDSGYQCPGVPITFKDITSSTLKPITSWYWDFGDGDTSIVEDPVHSYMYGGIYNVALIAQNIRNCIDTVVEQVLVDNFKPFAGNDTTIVKGAYIYFDAQGGYNYIWTPPTNLSDSVINDPIGYYPDTGTYTYYVYVTSELGCSGYDTIQVMVVNQAEFFVPTAFTPNGDGKNDVFRPVAVGYAHLNYFKIFDRWGELVYNSDAFDGGWDGTYKSDKAPMGTYFWEMSFIDRYGNKSTLKGDVTLIR